MSERDDDKARELLPFRIIPIPPELRTTILGSLARDGLLYREVATQPRCTHQWAQLSPWTLVCRVCGGYLVRIDPLDVDQREGGVRR